MAIRKQSDIHDKIISDIPDNNAGLVSAKDVRDNMVDIVDSINNIVASGDTDGVYPFTRNVRAKQKDGAYGEFIAESGITFANGVSSATQIYPYPGAGGIEHDKLANLSVGDDHLQYLPIDGTRSMEGPLAMDSLASSWIGSSGDPEFGLRFTHYDHLPMQQVNVGSGTQFHFNNDGSRISTGKGTAKAWINFDGSGTVEYMPVVRSSYNIDSLEHIDIGKYKLTFTSGTFLDNYYVAIGNSNSTTAAGSQEDFDLNTVGLVMRQGDDLSTLRTLTYVCRNDNGEYVDSEMNDLVVFGHGSGTAPATGVIGTTGVISSVPAP